MLPPRLSRTGRARLLTGIAAGSFLVMVAAYVAAPGDQRARAFVADVAWTWAAAYALVCCLIAWRGVDTTVERATWGWMAAGCASFLVGQVAWSADELWRGVRPPYPSLADIGFLGIYVCAAVAVLRLLRREQRQPADPEIT